MSDSGYSVSLGWLGKVKCSRGFPISRLVGWGMYECDSYYSGTLGWLVKVN